MKENPLAGNMQFDIHFGKFRIEALTQRGAQFVNSLHDDHLSPYNYREAIKAGLSVSFENSVLRNHVAI